MWRRMSPLTLLRRRQRGYTLAEIAAIIVVVGVLVAATLIPMGRLEEGNAYRQVKADMKVQQDAILGYAMSHRTREGVVVQLFSDSRTEPTLPGEVTPPSSPSETVPILQTFTLPGGRPYLPCPDANGDGYEDRSYPNYPGTLSFEAVQTLIIYLNDPSNGARANGVVAGGGCLVSRGVLPWKTLGVPETDSWGNRYTYQVDDVFSNQWVGFNYDEAIDAFEPRNQVKVEGSHFYEETYGKRGSQIRTTLDLQRVGAVGAYLYGDGIPLLICDADVTPECPGAASTVTTVASTMTSTVTSSVTVVLAAGRRATVAHRAGRRVYAIGDVIEGVAYAIISHGENGHGAVRGGDGGNGAVRVRCNPPVDFPAGEAEIVDLGPRYRTEQINFPFAQLANLDAASRYCNPVSGAGGDDVAGIPPDFLMVGSRRGKDADVFFDDVVVWGMRQDLVNPLTAARVFPQKSLPILIFDY